MERQRERERVGWREKGGGGRREGGRKGGRREERVGESRQID